MADTPLPIEPLLPRIVRSLSEHRSVVIEAPPGAGKTTRVPLALLETDWVRGGRLLVLEPRRIAARAAATHMSKLIRESVGTTVGYVTRDERRVSPRTRIEVITEGILTRRLQRDPSLQGVAGVLFDEFHERNLASDLGLAFALESRAALRPELRLVVMSATLDGTRIAALVDDCPVLTSEGRSHPVRTLWRPRHRRTARVESDVVAVVAEALEDTSGDLLVFLPGAGEIRRTHAQLEEGPLRGRADVMVAPLFGALPPAEQDRALDAAPPGVRKVVLATDIAETSLTIDGVRVVVDAGLTREPRFDAGSGMSRLVTVPVSRASADQRRGRAGRTAPGTCYRLWSEAEHEALDPYRTPEIAQTDLAPLALDVAAWGADGPEDLQLLDQPPARAYEQALELLQMIDAIDSAGHITAHGRSLAELPVHPRLAHMIVTGSHLDSGDRAPLASLACELAALLADRDVLITSRSSPSSDLSRRVDVLHGMAPPADVRVRRGALHRARRESERLRRLAGINGPPAASDRAGLLLACAYPDRIAVRRGEQRGTFVLSNGRGASLADDDPLAGEDLIVVADVDAGGVEARVHLAAAVDRSDLELVLGPRIVTEDVVEWDPRAKDVVAERRTRVGSAVLEAIPTSARGDERTIAALLEGLRAEGLRLLTWTQPAAQLRARLAFLRRVIGGEWPDVSDEALLADLERWLAPFLLRARRRSDLERVRVVDALRGMLTPQQLGSIDVLAPTHLQVPSGSHVRLDYTSRDEPVLPVRVQEMFGARSTPTIAGGRVGVLLELLSPARRPVQVTDDLAGFWERTYSEVRSQLRGRYPKHHWPEDPLSARPTSRTRPR